MPEKITVFFYLMLYCSDNKYGIHVFNWVWLHKPTYLYLTHLWQACLVFCLQFFYFLPEAKVNLAVCHAGMALFVKNQFLRKSWSHISNRNKNMRRLVPNIWRHCGRLGTKPWSAVGFHTSLVDPVITGSPVEPLTEGNMTNIHLGGWRKVLALHFTDQLTRHLSPGHPFTGKVDEL